MKRTVFLPAVALTLGAIALQPAAVLAQAAATTTPTTTMPAASDTKPKSALVRADQGYIKDIAQANLAEIATGQLALEKSQRDDVKKFAQMMVDEHSAALKEVQQLAQSKNQDLPTDPSIKQKAVATALKALSGETFDKHYVSQAAVGDHKRTVELLQKVQNKAKDADLKALATKMLPTVQTHLQHAEQLPK